ncbi:MAG: trigger factor [Firmicutes bacterium]|nr:trigger factor [Bacillota bacterium]
MLEKGDFAGIDFEGYLDGEAFPGGAAQGYTLEVGSGSFIPGFEEGLIGMELEEEREVKATFPEDYPQTDLAGKEAVFKVKLHDIKVKDYPVLDDDFAQSLGDFKTVEELKADLKKRRQEAKEQQAAREFEEQVVEKVVEGSSLELTDTLIDRELNYMIQNMEHDFAHRGLKLEEYLQYSEKTLDDLREELRPQAERRVKTDLVLSAVAKAEGITVSEDEIKERLEYLLQFYPPATQEKMMKEQKANVVEGIRSSLEREKTIKLLVDAVQKTETEEKGEEVKTE